MIATSLKPNLDQGCRLYYVCAHKQSMAKTFVLSDESLNSYGFRILTAGIDVEQFIKNPVMLFMHNRPFRGSKDEYTVIGRWENIRKEDGKLLADAVFDLNDPFAKSIADKVENDFLRMASIGARPIETSADPIYLVPGQQYETVTKCIAKEASIVDIGSNDNALALSDVPALYNDEETLIELSANGNNPLIPSLQNQNQMKIEEINLKDLAPLLGLNENPTAQEFTDVVKKLITEKATLVQQVNDLNSEKNREKIANLVDGAVLAKKITADQKASFVKLAEADFDSTKTVLDAMKAYQPIEKHLSENNEVSDKDVAELIKLSGVELWKQGKLNTLKAKNFEQFKLKYKEAFGKDYTE
jgi:hypothetical protein